MVDSTAIVIVNYNSQAMICDLLANLKKVVAAPFVTVIVDNSPSPDTDSITTVYPDAVIFRPGKNLGFAGGCNVGIEYALEKGCQYILLLNPDTRAEKDFLSPMLQIMAEYPDYGMLGPKIFYDNEKREIWNCGGKLNWWLGGQRSLLADPPDNEKVQPVTYLSGCAMLFRSKAVKDVGLMDDRYFLYFEDVDYVQAMLKRGWNVGYVHDAELFHQVSATTEVHSPDYVYYFSRNRVWFMRKWAKFPHLAVFMLYNTLVKIPAAWFVFGLVKKQPRLAVIFVKGYLDGLRNNGR